MSKIIMLGTGNAMCTRCYNTCFDLITPGGQLMVDAGGGNGIFRQLHKAGIGFESIRHLFVTHVHTDHILGAIWLIRKISPLIHKGHYEPPFTIFCNESVAHALMETCTLMLPEKICRALHDGGIVLQTVADGQTVAVADMQVTFFDIGSPKVQQYGFLAVLPDGQRLVCLGDEPYRPCNERYVRGCDWLLCEAFCLYNDRDRFRPYEKKHSTALDAGRTAQELGVKNLLLYHTEDTRLATRREAYTAEAKSQFTGNVFVPDDIETVNL